MASKKYINKNINDRFKLYFHYEEDITVNYIEIHRATTKSIVIKPDSKSAGFIWGYRSPASLNLTEVILKKLSLQPLEYFEGLYSVIISLPHLKSCWRGDFPYNKLSLSSPTIGTITLLCQRIIHPRSTIVLFTAQIVSRIIRMDEQ